MHDIAQIKSLLPTLIKFAYIERSLLQVHAEGHDAEKARKAQERDRLFVIPGPDSVAGNGMPQVKDEEQVLVFEFNDGELKGKGGKVIHKRFA